MKNIDGIEVFLLRCFATLMTERSVSRAADALETSQPALSKALARLRKLFNDPLLIRARGHMVPTDRALELEAPVRRILDDLAGVMEAPRGFDPHNAEATFRFTSTETAERLIFPRLLARLQDSPPAARLPTLMNLAAVCGEQNKLEEAEHLFRQALALAPNHPRVSTSFASFLADHQLKLDEALTLATRAVRSAPDDPTFLDALGWVRAQRGEFDAAERTLQRALNLALQKPPADEIREHLEQVQTKKRSGLK